MAIPFTQYLNVRKAYGPSFSPDGKRLALLTNITGIPQAWVVNSDGGWPDQLTFHMERVFQVAFSPITDQLIFLRDIGGNENAQIFLVYDDEGHGLVKLKNILDAYPKMAVFLDKHMGLQTSG